MSPPSRAPFRPFRGGPRAAWALALLAGCSTPLLDQPAQTRQTSVPLAPLVHVSSSPDGSSHQWSALFWLFGQDVEGQREHARALPFWWRDHEPPYRERTLVLPFWYSEDTPAARTRFWSLLYGYTESDELRTDYVLPPLFVLERGPGADYRRAALLLAFDWRAEGEAHDLVLLNLLGLATGLRAQTGRPAEGETVGALGRTSSRRIELLNVLGIVSLFGYDDVGDRREWRLGTLFSNEVMSLARSWRSRGDDPFVREWIFPVYMNVADASGGFHWLGPLWGGFSDTASGRATDWWLAGLLARTRAPEGETWRVLGLPVVSPD